jgi:hypothetical protein
MQNPLSSNRHTHRGNQVQTMIVRIQINESQTQTHEHTHTGYIDRHKHNAQNRTNAKKRTDTQTRPPTTHANFTQQETSLERVGVVKGVNINFGDFVIFFIKAVVAREMLRGLNLTLVCCEMFLSGKTNPQIIPRLPPRLQIG